MHLLARSIIGVFIYTLITAFKMWIVSRRLLVRFDWKLLGVTMLADVAVVIAGSVFFLFIPDSRLQLFILQLLLVLGIEAPVYQLFYNYKSYYDIMAALLIARTLFMLALLLFLVIGVLLTRVFF